MVVVVVVHPTRSLYITYTAAVVVVVERRKRLSKDTVGFLGGLRGSEHRYIYLWSRGERLSFNLTYYTSLFFYGSSRGELVLYARTGCVESGVSSSCDFWALISYNFLVVCIFRDTSFASRKILDQSQSGYAYIIYLFVQNNFNLSTENRVSCWL